MRLAVLGAGAVGAAVTRLAPGEGHRVVALADSTGAAVDPSGIDPGAVLARKAETGSVGSEDRERALGADYDALVEATPTTLGDAQPGFGHCRRALARDRDVVLANKGPVAERYADLRALEADSGGRVLFEATVGAGLPVLSTVAGFGAGNVDAVRGVLNGTANFVLSRMAAEGLDYEHVLAEAQDLGVAEADPSFDVDGVDAALKCTILANVLADAGHRPAPATDDGDGRAGSAGGRDPPGATPAYSLSDADVTGIRAVPGSALELAREDGRTVRLVGEATPGGARVGPRLVGADGPFAVDGTRNVVRIETAHAGRVEVAGRGAGGEETAAAVLADVGRLPD